MPSALIKNGSPLTQYETLYEHSDDCLDGQQDDSLRTLGSDRSATVPDRCLRLDGKEERFDPRVNIIHTQSVKNVQNKGKIKLILCKWARRQDITLSVLCICWYKLKIFDRMGFEPTQNYPVA